MLISRENKAIFEKDGVIILKGFYDVDEEIVPIQKAIYNIIGLVIKKYQLPIARLPFNPNCFDEGFQEVLKSDRQYASEIYDAVKQIPAFIRLVGNEKHEMVFSQLFNTEVPGVAAAGYGIRIDNPREDRFRAPWHQEFLSQLRSLEGVVFWSPLLAISEELGPVEFCISRYKVELMEVCLK
ncbi:MAG: hypothetical protein R8K22_07960 [Mariprofundaceae bacterium]